MSRSTGYDHDEHQVDQFVGELLDRLVRHGYAERQDGKIRLTRKGSKTANPEGRPLRDDKELTARMVRLISAVGLSPFEVVTDA